MLEESDRPVARVDNRGVGGGGLARVRANTGGSAREYVPNTRANAGRSACGYQRIPIEHVKGLYGNSPRSNAKTLAKCAIQSKDRVSIGEGALE